jgi:curved DNA-binding protein CbpA
VSGSGIQARGEHMAIPDYYAILEVSRSASAAEIKQAYRRLVRSYHPDLNGQSVFASAKASETRTGEASRHLALLKEAYTVLNNPQKRAAYDARRRTTEVRRTTDQPASPAQAPRRQPIQSTSTPYKQEPKMTWREGVFGFVRELKKAMRED